MKNNVIKVVTITLLALLLVASIIPNTYSLKYGEINEHSVSVNAEDNSGAADSVNRIVGALLTTVQVVGSGVAVIMLIVLAIKYISAAPSDKAEIKKHAVVYVVGAVVLFAATGIISIVRRFAGNVHEN
jgi:hypothetical protein